VDQIELCFITDIVAVVIVVSINDGEEEKIPLEEGL
jgi:hypothetical protein